MSDIREEGLSALLHETRTFPPSAEFAKQANAQPGIDAEDGKRPGGSAIYYLLLEGEASAPHRVDAAELWHFYDGDPLELRREWTDGRSDVQVLGPDVMSGQSPQVVVDAGVWQSARPLGRYALVGATVTPAFVFEGFELRQDPAGPR